MLKIGMANALNHCNQRSTRIYLHFLWLASHFHIFLYIIKLSRTVLYLNIRLCHKAISLLLAPFQVYSFKIDESKRNAIIVFFIGLCVINTVQPCTRWFIPKTWKDNSQWIYTVSRFARIWCRNEIIANSIKWPSKQQIRLGDARIGLFHLQNQKCVLLYSHATVIVKRTQWSKYAQYAVLMCQAKQWQRTFSHFRNNCDGLKPQRENRISKHELSGCQWNCSSLSAYEKRMTWVHDCWQRIKKNTLTLYQLFCAV